MMSTKTIRIINSTGEGSTTFDYTTNALDLTPTTYNPSTSAINVSIPGGLDLGEYTLTVRNLSGRSDPISLSVVSAPTPYVPDYTITPGLYPSASAINVDIPDLLPEGDYYLRITNSSGYSVDSPSTTLTSSPGSDPIPPGGGYDVTPIEYDVNFNLAGESYFTIVPRIATPGIYSMRIFNYSGMGAAPLTVTDSMGQPDIGGIIVTPDEFNLGQSPEIITGSTPAIDPAYGYGLFNVGPITEDIGVYDVKVSNLAGPAATYPQLTVNPNISPPSDILLSDDVMSEHMPEGYVIATLTAVDPNPGDTFTFELILGSPYFVISGDQLIVGDMYDADTDEWLNDYEVTHSNNIVVRVTDSTMLSLDKSLTIYNQNVNETVTATPSIAAFGDLVIADIVDGLINPNSAFVTIGSDAIPFISATRSQIQFLVPQTSTGVRDLHVGDAWIDISTSITVTRPGVITADPNPVRSFTYLKIDVSSTVIDWATVCVWVDTEPMSQIYVKGTEAIVIKMPGLIPGNHTIRVVDAYGQLSVVVRTKPPLPGPVPVIPAGSFDRQHTSSGAITLPSVPGTTIDIALY